MTRRSLPAGAALAAGLALLSGCTGGAAPPPVHHDQPLPPPALRLVSFDSCADTLAGLRKAAKEAVGPYGFGFGWGDDMRTALPMPAAGLPTDQAQAKRETAGGSAHSGTNTHEPGADEPDRVKTDGRRIVTVSRGILRVVDVASRRVTGTLDLSSGAQDPVRWGPVDLLLQGDHALIVAGSSPVAMPGVRRAFVPIHRTQRLLLVDLAGPPRLLTDYRIDGELVDARQMGATVRVVVRSQPRLTFPYRPDRPDGPRVSDDERTAANKKIIDHSGIDAWLPGYEIRSGDRTVRGRIPCESISRPTVYSGTAMISVLTFDLGATALGTGDPLTVVADGNTVYSNGPSLYLANDQQWRFRPMLDAGGRPAEQRTDLYKFDTSGPGRPNFVAAGTVDGWLINQYAMSEWQGNLRVATTTGTGRGPSSSTVYVLSQQAATLAKTGSVTGLGKGERIYSVRFAGPVGYVVTFRQTDPLYTVDLSDPGRPRVTGELKITGYSAYLHPIGDNRLLGVGQEATREGRPRGAQVSLFDVSDPARPARLAQHMVRGGYSEAEFNPHAFLYWPADRLLVLPMASYGPREWTAKAMVLRVDDRGFVERGAVSHPVPGRGKDSYQSSISRSLVIDGTLWTLSDAGLKGTSVSTLDTTAWLPW